jgi:steroid delta-isomerase-like uncharacterized protein
MAMLEENKWLIQHYYEKLWNQWEISLVDEIISEAIEFRGSIGLSVRGRDGFTGYVETIRTAFPDFHNRIDDLIAEENKVVALLTYTGTHQGMLFDIAPTGKRVEYAGTAVFRIEGGQIASGWVLGDRLGLLQQLNAPVL